MALHEFNNKTKHLQEEVDRRIGISDYLLYLKITDTLTYEDITHAISWLDHTTLTSDEIIDILKKGE